MTTITFNNKSEAHRWVLVQPAPNKQRGLKGLKKEKLPAERPRMPTRQSATTGAIDEADPHRQPWRVVSTAKQSKAPFLRLSTHRWGRPHA